MSHSNEHTDAGEKGESPLFGSLLTELTDQVASNLTAALRGGIEKLPMLQDLESLLQQLQKHYDRNIDLFEIYCQRNLFSLQHFPPLQRQKITQIFMDSSWDPSIEDENEQEENPSSPHHHQHSSQQQSILLPTKAQIPSPSKLTTAEQELLGRQQHLNSLRERRVALEKRIRELAAARQLMDLAASSTMMLQEQNIPNQVATTLQESVDTTKRMQQQGKALAMRMQDLKRQRDELTQESTSSTSSDVDSDGSVLPLPILPQVKKNKGTLSERCQENCANIIRDGTQLDKLLDLMRK